MPDRYPPGLDPAHVLAVCSKATKGRRGLAFATQDGMRVCLPSKQAAHTAWTALTRVGYQATVAPRGQGRGVTITGWSPDGLDRRVEAMRTVIHHLGGPAHSPALTAIRQFHKLPDEGQTSAAAIKILDHAGADLRAWVSARSGIHAPHDPTLQPGDVATALRVRATWVLEHTIDDLLQRHLRVAGNTLALYLHLRNHMPGDEAQASAAHWAGEIFRLSSPTGQNSPSLTPATAAAAKGANGSPASPPPGVPDAKAGQRLATEFPAPITTALGPPPPTAPGRPGWQRSPQPRPGRGR